MSKRLDITGERYGLLTAVKFLFVINERSHWLFICDCGTFLSREAVSVRSVHKKGSLVNCGCETKKIRSKQGVLNRTHGLSKHKLYDVHRQMLRRCYDQNSKDYPLYGGRGIIVFDDWHNLETFINWAEGSGYREGLTIERVDVNDGYFPHNCTWIANELQAHNTRRLHRLTVNGESRFIAEWARVSGVPRNTIHSRLRYGWTPEEAVTVPVGEKRGG